MNNAEECYLKNYTSYGIYEDDDIADYDDYDEMAAAEMKWEMANGR